MTFIRLHLRWWLYNKLYEFHLWAERKSLDMIVKLDKDDPHFADRKWANELNSRRALRGEPMSGMWIKPDNSKKRWHDYYERPIRNTYGKR